MKLELYIQNSEDGTIYNISDIAERVTVKKSVDGTAGQLTCILQKDPNGILTISNGSTIWFRVNDVGYFYGYVFKIGTDADENYKITCYDQLRYLKNSDLYTFRTETASQIFEKICKDYDLKYEVRVPTNFKPSPYTFLNKNLYSIIKRGMDLATVNDGKYYYIIDDYGKLVWSEFGYEGEKLSVQLGDASMVTSFTYEKSIDSDTYNRVKLYLEETEKEAGISKKSKKTGKVKTWVVFDSNNIKKWGILQLFKQANDKMNEAQIREQAQNYLNAKNRETETLKIQAEGVLECVAGKRLRFVLARENIDKWMWIKSSTHTFSKYEHTMDLEVQV